ncbi:unnamed protein product [marine sediment metagenome]|uniref:Uncharacterized protein n=1 Tax=marine sediment metagenome TaxID=412755 RepID=X0TDJ7_9ZZZZ
MTNKWLSIEDTDGDVFRIRKDKIVAISLPGEKVEMDYKQITIYVQTHVGRTMFNFGLHYPKCFGFDYYLDEKTFNELKAYLDRATRMKGELNLDPE